MQSYHPGLTVGSGAGDARIGRLPIRRGFTHVAWADTEEPDLRPCVSFMVHQCWLAELQILRKVLGAIIHLVLIVAIVAIVWHFVGPVLR